MFIAQNQIKCRSFEWNQVQYHHIHRCHFYIIIIILEVLKNGEHQSSGPIHFQSPLFSGWKIPKTIRKRQAHNIEIQIKKISISNSNNSHNRLKIWPSSKLFCPKWSNSAHGGGRVLDLKIMGNNRFVEMASPRRFESHRLPAKKGWITDQSCVQTAAHEFLNLKWVVCSFSEKITVFRIIWTLWFPVSVRH